MVVPGRPFDLAALRELVDLLRGRRLAVLTGAGCSTESGIPDYRGSDGRLRARSPIHFGEFVRRPEARVRYWARSAVGWPRMSAMRPNPAHRALAELEAAGVVAGVITQNVDGLHQAAGSRSVVELHGTLSLVRCLECDHRVDRDAFQAALLDRNAGWLERLTDEANGIATAPDGDAELPGWATRSFRVPGCERCDGVVKPDVVLFGENVPGETVASAWGLFSRGEVLLVVGSSLAVYSGRRFVYRARQENVPIGLVNVGPTRADHVAAAKVGHRAGRVLPRLARALLD